MVDPIFVNVDPKTVVVATFPSGQHRQGSIWLRRFMGVKIDDNPDGTIRVQVYGPAPNDFRQSVFRKA
jgi:hypothetical protein